MEVNLSNILDSLINQKKIPVKELPTQGYFIQKISQ
jgi:hypothetical protein